jgi:hypothetical protein
MNCLLNNPHGFNFKKLVSSKIELRRKYMPTDVIITLERLRCLVEDDGFGPSEPYIWPFLMSIDKQNNLIFHSLPLNFARVVIKDGMRANEVADIPQLIGVFHLIFDNIANLKQIVLLVTLLESDSTSDSAIENGFQTYNQELESALSDFKLLLRLNSDIEDDRNNARNELADRVGSKVKSAIGFFDSLDPDDLISSDTSTFKLEVIGDGIRIQPSSFTMSFVSKTTIPASGVFPEQIIIDDNYQIEGKVEMRLLSDPPRDLCQSQVDLVNIAEKSVNAVENQIENLQQELQSASPSQKPGIIRAIGHLENDQLPNAISELETAQSNLQACRDNHPSDPAKGPPVTEAQP